MNRMQPLIIWCTAFIWICGENEVSSCDVMAEVRRGETKRVSPGQNLTVECTVKHCGESFIVRWFKFSKTLKNWEAIPVMENIKITQKYNKENLISYLSLDQVSINDDGLYQCALGHSNEIVSHSINISVSELNKGVENTDNDADSIDDDRSSLSIFLICVTIIFVIAAAIVLILVCCHGWKQTWTCNNKNQAEISTHMIPELPKTSASSSPSLRTPFSVLNDIYSSSKPEKTSTSTSPALALTGNVADTAANSQASNCAVYTMINYQQCVSPARNDTSKQDEKANCCYQRLKS
ncbi:uncharacterized protein LOC116722567 [Xiphophorus hellerii]|uniref:uncharacterized protein LOC116722567 n=1 Tax=Xiphophorus hellerii TaxID=8084 RepID=UPI0013B3D2E9|nr:uncharacterized protein LOC116722567 [Xiphophorus hellerii]